MGSKYWMPKKPKLPLEKHKQKKPSPSIAKVELAVPNKFDLRVLPGTGRIAGKNKSFSGDTYLPNFDEIWCQEIPKSKRKLLFIDIPKTGSTSIKRSALGNDPDRFIIARKVLGENGLKRLVAPSGVEVKGYLDSFQKNRCKWKRNCSSKTIQIAPITIVRNPYTWFRSFYTHGSLNTDVLFNRTNFSFKGAVMAWCNQNIKSKKLAGGLEFGKEQNIEICDQHRWKFCDHIFSNDGHCFIKIIVRFERLKEAYDILCEQLAVDTTSIVPTKRMLMMGWDEKESLPHLMEAPCDTFDDQYLWDDEMIETFGNFYKKELQLLGYNFEGPIDNSVFVNPNLIK